MTQVTHRSNRYKTANHGQTKSAEASGIGSEYDPLVIHNVYDDFSFEIAPEEDE